MSGNRFASTGLEMATLTLIVVLAAPGVVQADYRESYLEDRKAAGSGDWPTVVRSMEQAITERPQPAPASSDAPDSATWARLVSETEAAFAKADARAERLSKLRDDLSLAGAWNRSPSLVQPSNEAVEALERARELLATGREEANASAFEEAGRLAVKAEEEIDGVVRRAEGRWRDVEDERRRREFREQIVTAAREAENLLGQETAGEDTAGTDVGRSRNALEDTLARVEGLDAERSSVATLGQLRGQLSREIGRYREAAQASRRSDVPAEVASSDPREIVRTAAQAYLGGDYGTALETLSGLELDDEKLAAQALLFRAAARYALYLLRGEREKGMVEAARADVAFCRRLAPELRPDPRMFSPRFVQFFEER